MITYQTNTDGVRACDIDGFYVDWPNPPDNETFLRVLDRSAHRVLARDGKRVVGFITAISDGVLSAYIPLLEVLPDYQTRGIGSELVRRMRADLSHL